MSPRTTTCVLVQLYITTQTQSWKLCASSRLLSHVSRASANSLLETELELGQRGQVGRQPTGQGGQVGRFPGQLLPPPPPTDRKCLPCWQRLLHELRQYLYFCTSKAEFCTSKAAAGVYLDIYRAVCGISMRTHIVPARAESPSA